MVFVGLLDHFMDLLGAVFLVEKTYKLARWWHAKRAAKQQQ